MNERNVSAGKSGWCIVCRNTANLACDETNIPVCSKECAIKHKEMAKMLETYLSYKEEKKKYIEDAVLLFRSVCKFSQKDMRDEAHSISLKSKIISLELILSMVQSPPEGICAHPDFLAAIKDYLSESILKNSVSNEKQIFSLSFSIFTALLGSFRKMLKSEIGVFIEEIFLNILNSGNSGYQHKFVILQVFNKIAQNPKFVLEIFVNYDCDIETRDIFERIVECLGKIAKGKYTKTEHAGIIQPDEERSLKLMALEILTSIVKNCYEFMVSCEVGQVAVSEDQRRSTDQEQSKTSDETESEEVKNTINSEGKYEKALKNKIIINKAVIKFNIKPKNGINYLIQEGCIAKDPEEAIMKDIVNFIKNTPGLNKSKIGEYFGDDSDIAKKVMHFYIDLLDFKKMAFVGAMRFLVAEFRLPGESQKIDRILMKFGQKYYQDNPGLFVSANVPYELSYAVMILQTATHNPQVKQKMTFDGFLTMSKDIRRSYNLTEDFMKTVYDDIKQNPITLADDEVAKLKRESSLANGIKKKQDLFVKETQHMVKKGKELIQKKKTDKGIYEEVKNAEPLRAMFEVAWSGMLAVFSSLFEEEADERIWQLCLEGFAYSIKITANLNMVTELDAFVSVLDKFTLLTNLKDIKPKNIECLKLLIDIAMRDGNTLRNAWIFVLQSLSRLDYLHSVATAVKKEYGERASKKEFDAAELEGIERVAREIDQSKLDAIFSLSVALDSEGIADFICNLCKISRDELVNQANPQIFSLQKLVEVADLNMSRIAFVWKDIWKDISQHLIEAGKHPNSQIPIFALDSLKQLAHKFLAKEELASYKYQKEFLKPFEKILEQNLKRYGIIDFLINCVVDICRKCGKSIKSGWSIVFNIIGLIGKSIDNENVVSGSFSILDEIIKMDYEYLAEYFEDALSCIFQYCGNVSTTISLRALESINWAIKEVTDSTSKLATGLTNRFSTNDRSTDSITIIEDSKITFDLLEFWTILFRGLQCLIMDKRREIREKAATLLWNLLSTIKFTEAFWSMIYEIILGYIPKYTLHQLMEDERCGEFIKTTVFNVIDVFCNNFTVLKKRFSDFIEKMNGFIYETNSSVGIDIHKHFMKKIVDKYHDEISWEGLIEKLKQAINATLPKDLIKPIATENDNLKLGFSVREVSAQLLKHLNVLSYVRTTIIKDAAKFIPLKASLVLLESLYESASFASRFNKSVDFRTRLKRAGFPSQGTQLANLLQQETEALLGYLELSFEIYSQNSAAKESESIITNMWTTIKQILTEHIEIKDKKENEELRMITSGKELLISEAILPILRKLPKDSFKNMQNELMELLVDLVMSNSIEIRSELRETLKSWIRFITE